eukprot:3381734-Pyramimonas_sp.AAC.1
MIVVSVCPSRGVPTGWHPEWARSTLPLGLASTRCCPLGLGRSIGLPSVSVLSLRSLRPPTQLVAVRAVASCSRRCAL